MSDLIRHKKTGGQYEVLFWGAAIEADMPLVDYAEVVICRRVLDGRIVVRPAGEPVPTNRISLYGARVQTSVALFDGDAVVIYRGQDSDALVWARRVVEMNDGRFEPVTPPAGIQAAREGDEISRLLDLAHILDAHMEEGQITPAGSELVSVALGRVLPDRIHTVERCDASECREHGCEECPRDADWQAADERLTSWLRDNPRSGSDLQCPIPGQAAREGEHQEGRDPDGSGSRASIDPSRIADLARNVARSIMGGPAETCANRKEFLEGSIPLIEDALKSVREVPYGIIDPDYARIFTKARCIALAEGYALLMHGSFTRDLDLLAVPWAERACEPEHLARRIAAATDLKFASVACGQKPHGRLAWTLLFPAFGDPRFVDLSIMPRARDQRASREDGDSQPRPEAAL